MCQYNELNRFLTQPAALVKLLLALDDEYTTFSAASYFVPFISHVAVFIICKFRNTKHSLPNLGSIAFTQRSVVQGMTQECRHLNIFLISFNFNDGQIGQ